MAKIVKETIHAKGIDIGIYTTNFAVLINQEKNQKERMELLRQLVIQQLQTLETWQPPTSCVKYWGFVKQQWKIIFHF